MVEPVRLILETAPDPRDVQLLEEQIYEFNVAATRISDGELFGVFLRRPDGAVAGGADGWTWGGTCYLRHLFVAAELRGNGHGTRLMDAVEDLAKTRGCAQIVLESHDFQAPGFYRRRGFREAGAVDGYPRGHRWLVFVKPLAP